MKQSSAKRTALLLTLVLIAYFVLIGNRALYLLGRPQWDLKVLGAVVLVFPLIGVWIIVAELRFGFTTQLLAEELNAAGDEPEPDLPRLPSGRVDREAADAHFQTRQAEVEANPSDWRGWYHLGIAYDLAGDRRRARSSMRHAARLRYGKTT